MIWSWPGAPPIASWNQSPKALPSSNSPARKSAFSVSTESRTQVNR
jgi:hypothetical protein